MNISSKVELDKREVERERERERPRRKTVQKMHKTQKILYGQGMTEKSMFKKIEWFWELNVG